MEFKAALLRKFVAVVAAFALAFSGVSAFAATSSSDGGERTSASADTQDKCKKKKYRKKHKKKCKKNASSENPNPPSEEPPAEEPSGFVPGRVVELTYMGPAIGGADTPAANPWGLIAPVNFVPGAGETQAMIEIVDDNSPNASAGFSYDSDGDGLNDSGFDVCGTTEEPTEVIPGTQYNIFPYLLPSTTCTDGVATSGTIIVTFNQV
jgi:hypothetical protein